MNVPQGANDSAVDLDAAGRAFERATGRVRDVAAFADGRMNAELELLGHGDLDLRVFARGPKHADALDAAFRPDNRQLFLAGILARLRKVGMLGELMSLAEQRLDMFLREMNMMRRDLDQKRLLLLRLQHTRDVRAAQRAQRLARHHAFLVGRHDEHRYFRVIGGNAADFVKPRASRLRLSSSAMPMQSSPCNASARTTALPWPMPPVKITVSSPPIDAT